MHRECLHGIYICAGTWVVPRKDFSSQMSERMSGTFLCRKPLCIDRARHMFFGKEEGRKWKGEIKEHDQR